MIKTMYILYKTHMKPIKDDLPDVVHEYVDDDAQFPWHIMLTKNKYQAMIFDHKEAEYYAYHMHFKIMEI